MATIYIIFDFSRDHNGHDKHSDVQDFEAEGDLLLAIDDYKDEALSELNDGLDDGETEWGFDEWQIEDIDSDLADPADFSDLNEYAEYAEACEENGEGYVLRYADIGENNFQDNYNGCWASIEEFAQDLVEGCYDIPDHLHFYIDWEKYASDIMMDYSSYDGDEGIHIFRD